MAIWNPWHGCKKFSAGCRNCYMYRRDILVGRDPTVVQKTASFDLPVRRGRYGEYKLQGPGSVYACMTSDFFLEEADEWRAEAWRMIRQRSDLRFVIVTKRIARFTEQLPPDWGDGYENVTVCCTCEDQDAADRRLGLMLELPIRHRAVIHEPMLEAVDIRRALASGKIEYVICGGESGPNARLCDYAWVLSTRDQCAEYGVPFHFKQTGALFRKDGRIYRIDRKFQLSQADRAGISTF